MKALSWKRFFHFGAVLVTAFFFFNAIYFFSHLLIQLPDRTAICSETCNTVEQVAYSAAWTNFRLNSVVLLSCFALLFFTVGAFAKKPKELRWLTLLLGGWFLAADVIVGILKRDLHIQFTNPAFSSEDLLLKGFLWLMTGVGFSVFILVFFRSKNASH